MEYVLVYSILVSVHFDIIHSTWVRVIFFFWTSWKYQESARYSDAPRESREVALAHCGLEVLLLWNILTKLLFSLNEQYETIVLPGVSSLANFSYQNFSNRFLRFNNLTNKHSRFITYPDYQSDFYFFTWNKKSTYILNVIPFFSLKQGNAISEME